MPTAKPASAAPLWWVRLTQFEFWNQWVFYVPIIAYYAWLSLRARSLTFFTAANPGLDGGGFIGESKWEIYRRRLPPTRIPKTVFVPYPTDPVEVVRRVEAEGLCYPVLAKPDVGERGRGVERLATPEALAAYAKLWQENFLVQQYVDLPFEAGVFYYRLPGETKGRVSSIVIKEFLSVTGDGVSTLAQLIGQYDRARFQQARLAERFAQQWQRVIPLGEIVVLESIGNHSRGTKFVNGNALITPELTETFEALARQIEGFWFGRFDLRAPSAEAMQRGEFTVIELNGVISEPGHVYDPSTTLAEAYRTFFEHWSAIYRIARHTRRQGAKTLRVSEGIRRVRRFFRAPQYGKLV